MGKSTVTKMSKQTATQRFQSSENRRSNKMRKLDAYAERCKNQSKLTTLFAPLPPAPPVVGQPMGSTSLPVGTSEVVATALDHGADKVEMHVTAERTDYTFTKKSTDEASANENPVASPPDPAPSDTALGKRKAPPAQVSDGDVDSSDDDEPPSKRRADSVHSSTLPSMIGSSRKEVVLVAHILSAYNANGHDALVKALNDGKSRGLTDAAFVDLEDIPETWFEYDPGFTHDKDRVDADVRKTMRMLDAAPANALIVRLRVDAPSIDDALPDDPRLLIVETTDSNPSRQAALVAKRVAESGFVSAEVKARLLRLDGAKNRVAENTAHSLLLRIDREYKRDLERLSQLLGDEDARRMVNCHGVKSRIGEFIDGYSKALREWQLPKSLMTRLVNNSCVPSRIDSPTFRHAVTALRIELGLSAEQLASLVGKGSVAKRVENESFRVALVDLHERLGLSTEQFVDIAGNGSAATRVENESFRAALVDLRERLGLSTEQLVKLAGNACAATRVESESFRVALVDLRDRLGLSTEQLVCLSGNGCAVKRMELESFRVALVDLRDQLGLSTQQLVGLAGNGCVASRIEGATYRAAIVTFASSMSNRESLCRLLKNNDVLASRVTPSSAVDMAAIVTHLNQLNLDGGDVLHTLLSNSAKMIDRLPLLRTKVESITDVVVMKRFVKSCKGRQTKRAAVALAL